MPASDANAPHTCDEDVSGLAQRQGQECFEIVCIGSGGGPDETNLSCYLLKPSSQRWEDGCIALDAGSGLGALTNRLAASPSLLSALSPSSYTKHLQPAQVASHIFTHLHDYLLTHSHLDHIAALPLNSSFSLGPYKRILGTRSTLKGVDAVFSGTLWPRLASWEDEGLMRLVELAPLTRHTLHPHTLSAEAYPISHGAHPSYTSPSVPQPQLSPSPSAAAASPGLETRVYESTAYFINASDRSFLFWGDVEPDALSSSPRNRRVWEECARRFVDGRLNWVWLECSYTDDRLDHLLYGHLTPTHLIRELQTLAALVTARRYTSTKTRTTCSLRPLRGLTLAIIHIKESPIAGAGVTAAQVMRELRALGERAGLGVEWKMVEPGERIVF